jgi:hypothetical protein
MAVENALLRKKGADFEKFFTKTAILMWGDDFQPWKPQGPYGDFKCDGYRVSERAVFQCNAPEQFVARDVERKIEEDFEGARTHFGDQMKVWVFVHNQEETPAKAANRVLQLGMKYPDLQIKIWTFNHLFNEVLKLPDAALNNILFGFTDGHELTPNLKKILLKELESEVERQPPPTPAAEPAPVAQPNRSALHDAMEDLSEEDKEVRRRLLGYSRWFDPATKEEVNGRIAALGHKAEVILINAQRLQQAGLIKVTENHYLSIVEEVSQQAAETLTDELVQELEA